MLKNKSLGLLILFLLFLSFLILSKSLQKQTPKPISTTPKNIIETSLLPSQTVINFYDKYLRKNNLNSKSLSGESLYLTDDFKNKLEVEISKKIIINPILCSSVKPDQIKVHSATLSGSLASVLITETLKDQNKDHVLKLKLVGEEYKIYDIICN